MERINYGKLMHEVFEGIDTADDIKPSVRKLVLEGKITEDESSYIEQRINSLISSPDIKEWFSHENKVLKEAGILLPSGKSRRPDRIIFRDGKTIIVDFKFGEPNNHYLKQLDYYRKLLSEMGYNDIEAFVWYVDNNLVVPA